MTPAAAITRLFTEHGDQRSDQRILLRLLDESNAKLSELAIKLAAAKAEIERLRGVVEKMRVKYQPSRCPGGKDDP